MLGKLFIIESGTDGSGKQTQTKLIYDRLSKKIKNIKKVEYPNYNSESSALVKMYLRGDFGKKAEDVDAYVASTFFAADRYASFKTEWEQFYNDGGIVIADRYVTSNMVHQASKMDDDKEKEMFLDWLDKFEYEMYKIPKPDFVIFLDVPANETAHLMENRKNKITNDEKKDIHESDYEYLKKTYENSLFVAKKYNWIRINCIKDNKLRTIEDIHEEIYNIVAQKLGL